MTIITASVGYTLPTSHPIHLHLGMAAQAIARESSGDIALKLFPHEQFGSDIEMLEGVFNGRLQIMVCTGPFLGRKVPAAAAPSVPFAFSDSTSVLGAMDGELGTHVRSRMAEAGVHAFPFTFDNGFRHLTTTERTVTCPGDLQDMVMRVVAAPLHESLWSALGTRTVSCDIADVHHLLSTGGAQGQDNTLPMIEAFRINEVQKHCALTGHLWEGFWIAANMNWWRSLDPAIQRALTDRLSQTALTQRRQQAEEEVLLRERLQRSMTFNEVRRDEFHDALARSGFYGTWQQKLGPDTWAVLQKSSGGLTR